MANQWFYNVMGEVVGPFRLSDRTNVSAPKSNRLRNGPKTSSNRAADEEVIFTDDDQKSRAIWRAQRIERIAKVRTEADLSLFVKLAVLVEKGEIPEDAIEQALEGIKKYRPRKPAAYLQRCVDNYIGEGTLNGLLSRIPFSARGLINSSG